MLLIGYGNPGRGDDGLGPAFVDRIAERDLPGVACKVGYQLTVDHALMIAEEETVVFVDALMAADAPFRFAAVEGGAAESLTSHSLSPASVVMLANTLYGKAPETFVLGIAGAEFGAVKEGLSATALRHLDLAETFFLDWVAGEGACGTPVAPRGRVHA